MSRTTPRRPAARRTRCGWRARSRMGWGCRTSRSICGRSSGPAWSSRSWPATPRGRRRTRASAATATCGSTRCSSSRTRWARRARHRALRAGHRDGLLRAAADPAKDQSYMLAALSPASLARMRFPLAELTKPEVRALAAEAGLPVASRADSQDLCFLAGVGKARFLARHGGLEDAPGEIVPALRRGRGLASRRAPLHGRAAQGARRGGGRAAVRAADRGLAGGRRHARRTRRRSRDRARRAAAPAGHRGRRRAAALPLARGAVPGVGEGPRLELELGEPFHGVAPGQMACLLRGDVVVGYGTIAA